MIEITLPLAPTPCPRPRVRRFGGVYYGKKYESHREAARKLIEAMKLQPVEGYFSVSIDFYSCVPKSHSKKQREACLSGLKYPSGDVDNMAKACLDFITAAKLWKDDSQVVKLSVTKQYALADSIVIRISHA